MRESRKPPSFLKEKPRGFISSGLFRVPLLLGGGARGGGDRFFIPIKIKIGRTLFFHPTPSPSPYRGGEYMDESFLGAGSTLANLLLGVGNTCFGKFQYLFNNCIRIPPYNLIPEPHYSDSLFF